MTEVSRILQNLVDMQNEEIRSLNAENERLLQSNRDLLSALEAVRGLADVSQDYQLSLICGNAIAKANSVNGA